MSFICVYRGWGSGSWSLTSKLAPGSWKGHGHHQGQPDHTGRTGRDTTLSCSTLPPPHPPRQMPLAGDCCLPPPPPHIIACQVRVVLLNAIIQNGDHNATPRVALGPGLLHVQVPLRDARLQRHPLPSAGTYKMWLLGEVTGTLKNPLCHPKTPSPPAPCS